VERDLLIRTPHRAQYVRVSHKIVNRVRTKVESAPKSCDILFEPMPPKWMATVAARIPSAAGTITWNAPLILDNGDKVIFDGTTYYLNEVVRDIYRGRWPYYTAIGSEKYHGTS
jgi:hypothetical protein